MRGRAGRQADGARRDRAAHRRRPAGTRSPAPVRVDAGLVHALADVRERMHVVADADADVVGTERPHAKLDGAVVQRGRAEAAFPGVGLVGGCGHPAHATHRLSRGIRTGRRRESCGCGGRFRLGVVADLAGGFAARSAAWVPRDVTAAVGARRVRISHRARPDGAPARWRGGAHVTHDRRGGCAVAMRWPARRRTASLTVCESCGYGQRFRFGVVGGIAGGFAARSAPERGVCRIPRAPREVFDTSPATDADRRRTAATEPTHTLIDAVSAMQSRPKHGAKRAHRVTAPVIVTS